MSLMGNREDGEMAAAPRGTGARLRAKGSIRCATRSTGVVNEARPAGRE
jgi:hypothetical protein